MADPDVHRIAGEIALMSPERDTARAELTFGLRGVSPQVRVSADGWLTCDHHV
jgi:hypothetical protein